MLDRVSDRRVSTGQLALVLWLVLALMCSVVGCQTKKKQTDPRFTAGRQALMRGQYDASVAKLGEYLKRKPKGGLASRASFLIAKAHIGLGNYDEARRQFEQTIQKYGSSEEAHKSRYKLAVLSLIEGDPVDARRRFDQLIARPSGTLVPESEAMLRYLDGLVGVQAEIAPDQDGAL